MLVTRNLNEASPLQVSFSQNGEVDSSSPTGPQVLINIYVGICGVMAIEMLIHHIWGI